ncbi:MAG: methyltransferase, TIGR04325 family, partial [Oligoflexia bacterium]|nr:methyltransferase, TIGR04325 family [Oligoflexia bacterium]
MFKTLIKKMSTIPLFRMLCKNNSYGFISGFPSWTEALKQSKGYDSPIIFEKVRESAHKVINGETSFERDSVCFKNPNYNWFIVSSLLWISTKNNNSLNLLDYGGSLGSTFYQHRTLLTNINSIKWNIVEQTNFVTEGKKNFSDGILFFYETLEEGLKAGLSNSVLFSSSIQYLEKPFEILKRVFDSGIENIIIHKTPFFIENR